MKLSYNWLKQFVDIKTNPEKLAENLTLFGHEVDGIEKVGNDCILDVSLTANRGDCQSILGLAREISALYDIKLRNIIDRFVLPKNQNNKTLNISINDAKICPRYSAIILDNIKISASPKWVQERLTAVGIRPINNIVDATNFVMVELGQPMHAFDYGKIKNGEIFIDLAKDGESLITLDGKEKKLDKNTVIIKDSDKIYDLSGIMGGYNSEITTNTKTIILQAAIFDPVLIRKTCKRLNFQTEASYKYERGVDKENTLDALLRAIEIISETSPIDPSKLFDIQSDVKKQTTINVTAAQINSILGTNLTDDAISKLLARTGIVYKNSVATIPSWRQNNITIYQDLADEVARIYGYNNLKLSDIKKEPIDNKDFYCQKEHIKDILANNGFTEIYSYSFTDKILMQKMGFKLDNCERVINSVAPELEYLRPDLAPSILTAISKNPWAPEIEIFEIGKVFEKNKEKWQLAIAVCAKKDTRIKEVLDILKMDTEIVNPNPEVLNYLKIRKSVKYATVDLKKDDKSAIDFLKLIDTNKAYTAKTVSQFPPTIRDLAFVVDVNKNANDFGKLVQDISDKILFVELFDEFASDKFGVGKKNIAYHIWLQDIKGPMNEAEVSKIINSIIEFAERNQAELRK